MRSIKRILILLVIILLCVNTFALAVNTDEYEPNEMSQRDKDKVGKTIGNVLTNIRTMGIILSIIIIIIMGIKYMVSSVEEKANYKESAVPYIVGVLLLAGTTILPDLIWDIMH